MKARPIGYVIAQLVPWILLVAALLLVFAQVQRAAPLVRVWAQWAEIGALAVVMTGIIITGGIDLSVGSMVVLSAMVQAMTWKQWGFSIETAVLAGLAAGFLAGSLNGILVVIGMSPLVATLATMAFYSGLAMAISQAERVSGFPEQLLSWSQLGGCPTQFWLLLIVAVMGYVVLQHTRFGRRCFAIGDNPLAAEFAAVPTRLTKWLLYASSGLVAGAVAVLSVATRDAASPSTFQALELRVITCTVVGGTLITGGRGGVLRTLLGVAVVSSLDIGLEFLGTRVSFFSPEMRLVVIGVLLVVVAVGNEKVHRSSQLRQPSGEPQPDL